MTAAPPVSRTRRPWTQRPWTQRPWTRRPWTPVPVTVEAPRWRRLAAWAGERFPLTLVLVLLPTYLVALLSGRALTRAGPPVLHPLDLAGFLGVWAFFLLVRVIDEHKDHARDLVEHPERVLQRGVVTLGELVAVGAAAVVVQVIAVVAVDRGVGRAGLWWALTAGWTALAARDFLIGATIADRPVLYPLLHLPLSGLVCVWIAQLGAGPHALPRAVTVVALLGIVLAGVVDLSRKLVAPQAGGRSYAGALGASRAAVAAAVAVLLLTGTQLGLLRLGVMRFEERPETAEPVPDALTGPGSVVVAVLVVAAGLVLAVLARFATSPTARRSGQARAALTLLVPVQLSVTAAALAGLPGRW